MLQKRESAIGKDLLLLVFQFVISYIKYLFLTGSVIFSSVVLLFVILNINPDFSFSFLKYFSLINPIFGEENFDAGIKEIMQIFSVVSFILLILVSLLKISLKKLFNTDILIGFKLKLSIIFGVISAAYIFAFLIVAFTDSLDKGFYVVFAIFYIINLVSALFYFLFDYLLKKMAYLKDLIIFI